MREDASVTNSPLDGSDADSDARLRSSEVEAPNISTTIPPELDEIRPEIEQCLSDSKGQIGLVMQCLLSGLSSAREITDAGAAANAGAASNLLVQIRTIRDGYIPPAPSRAAQSLSAARSFLRQHRGRLSPAAEAHVTAVIDRLDEQVNDRNAQEREEQTIQQQGDALEESLVQLGGIYVYTFPHYWRYPTVEGTNRTLLKVGMTTRTATERVRQQARLTGLPEDPLLLRVYQHPTRDPKQLEHDFHVLLDSAGHTRSPSRTGGREWFETSIDFLDAVASVLGLTISGAEVE